MAAGQDAEDLKIYLTAYRPIGTDIKVFARFLNGEDYDVITNKSWTLMSMDNYYLYSDPKNINDNIEYTFSVPTSAPVNPAPSTAAYLNSGILRYVDSNGSIYDTYKTFAIKFVLLSDNAALVPRVIDLRAIALQA